MKETKLAIVVSHPIQHFCPAYASWTKRLGIKLKVFFATSYGSIEYFDKDFEKNIKWDNLYLSEFDHEYLSNDDLTEIHNEKLIKTLENKLNEYAPDVVLTYGYAQKIQRRALRWAVKNNSKIFLFSDSELRHMREWYKRIIKSLFLPRYYKNVDAFLTIGDANEEYYKHYGVDEKIFFRTPYPIDIFCFEKSYKNKKELNNALRKKYNISSDNIIISVVGKLVEYKSQDHIIKAIKNLDYEFSNITLFVIGSGHRENEWKKVAEGIKNNRIVFTGFIAPNNLPEFYAATDIYIHSAFIEPHSVAISEAIYMGCPIIVSSYCGSYGPNDDVQENKNGFVYSYNNIEELSEAIRILVKDRNLRTNFRIYSRSISVKYQELAHFEGIKSALQAFGL